jgi:RNA polymerase sigma-70 factor, ECF subfamily
LLTCRAKQQRAATLASRSELSQFLEGIEKRAFKQAVFAVRDEEAALDIVQDAMLRLAEKYGARPAGELPMLFHRIMQNAIRDWYRRQKVRSLWTTLLSSLGPGRDDDDDQDPLETMLPSGGSNTEEAPAERLEREELDVAETARAMNCSEGSVKTHCSRAAHALQTALTARGITLGTKS